jgi:formate-dependent nitrite reductase membrane component NrfD
MADRMNIESAPYALPIGYAGQAVTKPPNWHAYVVLDTLLNNLSTGLFLVAGTSELVRPESFAGLTRWAYPIALVLLILDLVCLVLDLGDPLRFHHMLRVWKPRSPMSLGTWCLTAFGPLLTANALLSLWPDSAGRLQWLRSLIFILGAVPAVGVTVYKGVLFSTTAQPGWKDARWLGGYFSCSALGAGTGELLLLATVLNRPEAMAPLRLALFLLMVLNLIVQILLLSEIWGSLARAHRAVSLTVIIAVTILGGVLLPLALLASGGRPALVAAVLFSILGAGAVRYEFVRLPHLLVRASGRPFRSGS